MKKIFIGFIFSFLLVLFYKKHGYSNEVTFKVNTPHFLLEADG